MTQRHDGTGRGAEWGKWVRFTRLTNLCPGYSMTLLQNGTPGAGQRSQRLD